MARIGVTSWSEDRDEKPVIEINRSFVEGVLRVGGVPLVLPNCGASHARATVSALDGLVLTGGIDVDPASYGADRSPHVNHVDPLRDETEIALVVAAIDAGLPVLGLCRGSQLLNVALGGTLIQHLPEETSEPHDVRDRTHEEVHDVSLRPETLLASITGNDPFGVNSLHHQAVDLFGDGLQPVAWAPDGVVEAIEDRARGLLGVQWHPELMLEAPRGHLELFQWVVTAADSRFTV